MFLDPTPENKYHEEDKTVSSFKTIQPEQTSTNKLKNYPLVAIESHDQGNFQKGVLTRIISNCKKPFAI